MSALPPSRPGAVYRIRPKGCDETFDVILKGRAAWAFEQLAAAGLRGCTALDPPRPRWAAYINRLRANRVPILRETERHEGRFPGWHARYFLWGTAERVRDLEADEAAA
jgi:hypothetical protein